MGLYKKGRSNWYAAFSADGRHFNRSTGTSNKRRAQKILNVWLAEIIEGRFNLLKSHAPTLKDWSKQFLESIPHANTRRRYVGSKVALDGFLQRRAASPRDGLVGLRSTSASGSVRK